jgi:hypothetical protein
MPCGQISSACDRFWTMKDFYALAVEPREKVVKGIDIENRINMTDGVDVLLISGKQEKPCDLRGFDAGFADLQASFALDALKLFIETDLPFEVFFFRINARHLLQNAHVVFPYR